MSLFSFPELYCPFPSKVNKYADVLKDYALEWVRSFNLLVYESTYKRFSKSKFFLMVARTYPYSELQELEIINDWFSWLFIWDDQCDMSDIGKQPELLQSFHQRFIEILNGAELTKQDMAISYALGDLRRRILKRGNEKVLQQFANSCKDYFHGCFLQAEYRAQETVPDIDTYIMIRNLCSAVDSCLALIELGFRMTLPDFFRQHHSFKKLNYMTNNTIAWCNDIFSAPREIQSGDIHNLVYIIHYNEKVSFKEAAKRVAEIHDIHIRELIVLEKSFPSFGKDLDIQIAKYISGCNDWIRGNYDWYFDSGRYDTLEKLDMRKNLQLLAS